MRPIRITIAISFFAIGEMVMYCGVIYTVESELDEDGDASGSLKISNSSNINNSTTGPGNALAIAPLVVKDSISYIPHVILQ